MAIWLILQLSWYACQAAAALERVLVWPLLPCGTEWLVNAEDANPGDSEFLRHTRWCHVPKVGTPLRLFRQEKAPGISPLRNRRHDEAENLATAGNSGCLRRTGWQQTRPGRGQASTQLQQSWTVSLTCLHRYCRMQHLTACCCCLLAAFTAAS